MIRLLFPLLLLIFFSAPSMAEEKSTIDLSSWSSLPILHEGRVQPLSSFAAIYFKIFSQKTMVTNSVATSWLAETLFTPEVAMDTPVFKIRNAEKYGLPKAKGKLYNYVVLSSLIQDQSEIIQSLIETDEASWTPAQSDLMTLYQNFILHTQLLRSFTLLLPLNFNLPKEIKTNKPPKNFLDYKKIQEQIDLYVKNILRDKGSDIKKYTRAEQDIANLSYQLHVFEEGGQSNVLLHIIPLEETNKDTKWLAPWALIQTGQTSPQTAHTLGKWQNLVTAYRNNDAKLWNDAVVSLSPPILQKKLQTETLYNQLHLLLVASIFYLLSFFILITHHLFKKPDAQTIKSEFITAALAALFIGVLAHTAHIALRTYILDRPPVGTLYESILFVSLICTLGCMFLEWRQKNSIGLLLGGLSGVLLLATAAAFSSENTMGTLAAVLNTNFWLTTHVLCITIGYGWCIMAAFIAHFYLAQRLLDPSKKERLSLLYKNLTILSILSLLFTAVGTILGGIWADQSWGRFWGWDPKENGALLIVLWLIWILHGRISKHIDRTGFVAGTAFLSVIVVLAWFGVNLLNVGLHSYGFISGIAWGIGIFCAIETILIGGAWFTLHKKTPSLNKETS